MHGNTVGSRESLSDNQKAILIGKILGDGCLEKNGRHVRLRIEQADQQRDYVLWLYDQLTPFVGRNPYRIWHSGRNNKKTKRWRFSTLSLPLFDPYYALFYEKGSKGIPRIIESHLKKPLTLAIWYMDDGYIRSDRSGAYLCTSSFTQNEHRLLQLALRVNFGIQTSVHFAGGYARLHIPSRCLRHFINIVEPFILPFARYKLSLTP